MNLDTIGVGLVGLSATGGWASVAHEPALGKTPGVQLRALSASSEQTASRASERYGVPGYGSVEQMAARDDVDLVAVSVRVPLHYPLVTAALPAGKNIFCEWPLGNGTEEAQRMTTEAQRLGLRTFVGLQARSAPNLRFLRDLVHDGQIGEVLSTSMVASARRWGGSYHPKNEYLLDRRNGATMLTIPFAHTLDALEMVLGDLHEVNATLAIRRPLVRNVDTGALTPMTGEDQVVLAGTLQSGAVASMHFRGGLSRGTKFLWEINGTAGDIVVSGDTGQLQFAQVDIFLGNRQRDSQLEPMPTPERYVLPELRDLGGPDNYGYGVGHEYAQLVHDLRTESQTVPDFVHAVNLHKKLDLIHTAAQTGERVDLSSASTAASTPDRHRAP
ncbi:Gfo/Idh/MocA family protein [Dactylosporangium sp. CA-152071]|uniref:Gfo/Idh/MocA family protein n=1 Tax=Dactylosporangium sp. CA-152071 TaxID=3239933 RepID=UPI003D8A58B3